jgi:predicted porin
MKKNLLATSALIAAGALASQGALAEAKPISIKVGGYYEQWAAAIFQDADADNGAAAERYADDFDVQEDGEIHFVGSMTTDNGLTFGVNVQLEASTSGDQIDENYLFVRGSFGEIVLGSENGPAYVMHYGVDNDAGYGLEEGDTAFYWMSGGTAASLHTTRPAQIDNDGQKVRWISPRFSGVQVGLSYTPEARDDADGQVPNENRNGGGTREQIMAAGINYDMKFDDVHLRASLVGEYVGDTNGAVNGNGNEVWTAAAGLRLGFGGFDIAAAYKHTEGTGPATAEGMDVFAAGISYSDGPMSVSLTGALGQTDSALGNTRDVDQLVIQLGGNYKVGPGVAIAGTIVYANSSNLTGANEDYTGFGVVGGVKLNF